jgi:hypothetical protein
MAIMRPRLRERVLAVGALSALALSAALVAPAGAAVDLQTWALDPTFGGGDGTVTTLFPGGDGEADWGKDVAVQPNDRIVVAGTHQATSWRLGTALTATSTARLVKAASSGSPSVGSTTSAAWRFSRLAG